METDTVADRIFSLLIYTTDTKISQYD